MNNGAIIQARDLRKVYRVGKVDVPALRGVDLEVQEGEFLSIIGPSGSGKSTLFHIIGGLTPPSSGQVSVAGEDLAHMSDADRTRLRKRTVAFVFQKFNLLPNLTAADNIAIARHLAEGLGSRATARLTGVSLNTVLRFTKLFGHHAELFHDEMVRHVRPEQIQADEAWSFVGKKTRTATRSTRATPSKAATGTTSSSTRKRS